MVSYHLCMLGILVGMRYNLVRFSYPLGTAVLIGLDLLVFVTFRTILPFTLPLLAWVAGAVGVGDAQDDLVNLVAQALHGGKDLPIAEIGGQQVVHLLVEAHQLAQIVFRECLALAGEVALQFLHLSRFETARQPAHHPGLDGFAQLVVVHDVLHAQPAHDDALLR